MTEDQLTGVIAAEAMNNLWAHPVMKLSAISQAAANFASVARGAETINASLSEVFNTRTDVHPADVEIEARMDQCIRIRDVCLDHIEELLKQIKNEPTP